MGWKYTRSVNAVKLFKDETKYAKEMSKVVFLATYTKKDIPEELIKQASKSFTYNLTKYFNYGRDFYSLGLPISTTITEKTSLSDTIPVITQVEKDKQLLLLQPLQQEIDDLNTLTIGLQTTVTDTETLKVNSFNAMAGLTGDALTLQSNDYVVKLGDYNNAVYAYDTHIATIAKLQLQLDNHLLFISELTVEVLHQNIGEPILEIFGRKYIQETLGAFDPISKIFYNDPTKRYVGSGNQSRITPTTLSTDGLFHADIDILDPVFVPHSNPIFVELVSTTKEFLFPPPVDTSKEYLHIIYKVNPHQYEIEPNVYTKYFTYDVSLGTYPSILPQEENPVIQASYYPIVPIRLNKFNLLVIDPEPDYVTTGRKALKYIGLDYNNLVDELNNSPDTEHIEDAFVTIGIHINTQNKYSIRYLIAYFNWLFAVTPNNLITDDRTEYVDTHNTILTTTSANIKASRGSHKIASGEFGTKLAWDSIEFNSSVVGDLGKGIGHAESSVDFSTYNIINGKLVPVFTLTSRYTVWYRPRITFRYQDTPTTYQELKVTNLKLNTAHGFNGGSQQFITSPDVFSIDRNVGVEVTLDKESSKAFVIPLNKEVFKSLGGITEAEVAYDAVTLLIHITVAVYTPWWTILIKVVVWLIVIIIAIVAPPVGIPLLVVLAVGEVVSAILVATLEPKVAAIAGAVVSAVLALLGNVAGLANLANLAAKLINLATMVIGVVVNIMSAVTTAMIYDVASETEDFIKSSLELQSELDEKIELLGEPAFDPLMVGKLFTNFYQTPTQYYDRAFTANPSVEWLNSTHDYVKEKIRLPELKPEEVFTNSSNEV